MALIDLDITGLKQSANPRGSSPDGNIYFNPDGTQEIITVEELALVDGATNVISNDDGITMRALYAFERQERRTDENLRELDTFIKGSFKRAGAYAFIYGRTPSQSNITAPLTDDRQKIRSSGWIEYADIGSDINRIYFGSRNSGTINAGSQPYNQSSLLGTSSDFSFTGFMNEAVQVFGDATNGNFDNTSYFAASLRTWGQVHDRKSIADGGFTDAHGYSASLGLGERLHPYNTGFAEADVHTGTVIAPWTGMVFSSLDVARTETGLVGTGPYDFSFEITNSGNGTLAQLVAKCDAWARDATDVDAHATNTWLGKDQNTLYTLTPDGKVQFMQGLFPVGIPVADQINVILVSDAGNTITYESVAGGTIEVGDAAAADANAWYHMYYLDAAGLDDFNTLAAITVNDASGTPIKGSVGGLTSIPFDFAYSANVQGGFSVDTDRPVVIEVEGDGGCTSAKTLATIINSTSLAFSCVPDTETNI